MPDIATLGLAIDSSQLATGNAELDKTTAAATKAEAATKSLTAATEQLGTSSRRNLGQYALDLATSSKAVSATDAAYRAAATGADMYAKSTASAASTVQAQATSMAAGTTKAFQSSADAIKTMFSGVAQTVAAQASPLAGVFSSIFSGLGGISVGGALAGGALGVGAVAAAVVAVKSLSDAFDTQKRRLGDLLGDQRLAASAFADIRAQASAAGDAVSKVNVLYTNLARGGAALGATGNQVSGLTGILLQTGRLGGATADEQTAASVALARVLSESVVSATDLDTLFDNMPRLVRTIADGLGVGVTQLKLMAQSGDLTGQQVFGSLLSQQGKVKAAFDELPGTVGTIIHGLINDAEDLAVALYKSVTNLQLISDKRQQLGITPGQDLSNGVANFSNLHAPSGAMPTFTPSLEAQLNQNGSNYLAPDGITEQILGMVQASQKQADTAVLNASKMADSLDPVSKKLKDIQNEYMQVEQALSDLLDGKTTLTGDAATAQILKLRDALQALQSQAESTGTSYQKSIVDTMNYQQGTELGLSPGQRTVRARAQQFMNDQPGLSAGDATAQANAEANQQLDQLISKQQRELDIQTAITNAMRSGRAAADDAAVAMQVLGISLDQLGDVTPEVQVKLDILADTLGAIRQQQRAQSSIDSSKPLVTELAGIAAAMNVVTQGAYAMKRAEAEAKAARDENGTGGLQMQVFDARQNLTDTVALSDLQREIDLTNALAAAAGNVALQKKLQLDYDIQRAQQNAGPGAAAAIAEKMRADAQAKQNLDTANGAADLERQVELMRQETDIIRSGSSDYAAQIAMLEKRNELIGKGVDIQSQAAQEQISASGDLARLTQQKQQVQQAADATKRIWQNAYDNIQKFGGDTFYDLFTGVEVTAQSAADSLKKVFLRAFADIAAAAIIRPLIAPIFAGAEALGLAPAGVGALGGMGFGGFGGMGGSSAASVSGGNSGGSSGLSSLYGLFGGSGGSSWLGSFGNWLNNSTPFAAATPAGGFNSIDELIASGQAGNIPGAALGAGLTPMNVLGGIGSIAGIGLGLNTLLSGHGSTGSTVSGISGILGGGLGLASLIPGMQFLAPIGLALGIGGGLFGSLFGGDSPKIPPPPMPDISTGDIYGSGSGYTYSGNSQGGGSPLTAAARSLGGNILSLFQSAGLMVVPGQLIGGELQSGVSHNSWNGQQWSSTPYTQTSLIGPNGGRQQLTYNDSSMNLQQAADYLVTQIFKSNVLNGGVSGASDTLKSALTNINPTTTQDLQNVISLSDAYDKLGKAADPVKDSIDKINQSFADLVGFANNASLSMDPINDEIAKQTKRTAQDFIDSMLDPLAVQLRALDDEKQAALASAQYINENVAGVYADTDKIVAYYTQKQAQTVDQFYSGSLTNLQNLIARLTYGDLSNGSPMTQLAGAKSAYLDDLSKAQGGDTTAIDNLEGYAESYVTAARSAYGSSTDYQSIADEVRAALADIVGTLQTGGVGANPQATTDAANQVIESNAILSQTVTTLAQSNADLSAKVDSLTAQLQRVVVNQR